MTGVEMRRHPRYEVEDVEGTFLYNLELNVLNMSLAGMAVETTRPLSVGHTYSFTIHKGDDVVTLKGTVVWSVLGKTRRNVEGDVIPVYHAGVHFEDVLTDKASEIRHLIEESAVLDVNRRIFGRFRLGAKTSVTVDAEVEFQVRKLSLSGMLVETHLMADHNAVFTLEVNLGDAVIAGKGRVAYVRSPDEGEGRPEKAQLGVEFSDLGPEDRAALERFISSLVKD